MKSNDPLKIALTILHEGIHGEIWRYMQEHWPFGDWPENLNNATASETFEKLFTLCCNSQTLSNQHNLMLEQWLDRLAKGLWEFNGNQGDWETYKYLALKGIWNEKDPCSTNVVSIIEYNKYKADFKNITNNFDLTKCD